MPSPPPSAVPAPGKRRPVPSAVAPLREALERAVDRAVLAPSVHNAQPWLFELYEDRLNVRADHPRQLTALDPVGRELVQSLGAALYKARVSLAADGWAVEVARVPDPGDLDVLAVVRPRPGSPDAAGARLAPSVPRRRTNRRAFSYAAVPGRLVRRLTADAAEEDALLIPVVSAVLRQFVARLIQRAGAVQNRDPAYRAELRRWTTRNPIEGDGIPSAAVPHGGGPARPGQALRW